MPRCSSTCLPDRMLATQVQCNCPFGLNPSLEGAVPTRLRLGWCEDFAYGWADSEVRAAGREAALRLAYALRTALQPWEGLQNDPAPAWSTLFYASIARRLGVAEEADALKVALLDPLLRRQMAASRAAPSENEHTATANCCRLEIARAFERFDLLLMPTTPVRALPVGQDAPLGREAAGAVEWSGVTLPIPLTFRATPLCHTRQALHRMDCL